jgi:hypothetical protein
MVTGAPAVNSAEGTPTNPPFYADYSEPRNDFQDFVLFQDDCIAAGGTEAFSAIAAGFNNIPEPNSLSLGIAVAMSVLLRERSEIFGFRHQLAGNLLPVA